MARVCIHIHYSSPKAQGRQEITHCYDTPEKRRRKREKQRTADTLEQWDGVMSNMHRLAPTLKPIVFPNKMAMFEHEKPRMANTKVRFSYGDRQCQMLQQEICQLKQMLMSLEMQQDELMAARQENQAYYDRQQQQICQKCQQLKAHAQTRLLQLQEISQSLLSFSQ